MHTYTHAWLDCDYEPQGTSQVTVLSNARGGPRADAPSGTGGNRIGIADICQNCETGACGIATKNRSFCDFESQRPFSAIWADLGIAAAM